MTEPAVIMAEHRAHKTGCVTWMTSFAAMSDGQLESLRQAAGYEHCETYLLAYDLGKMQTALLLTRKSHEHRTEQRDQALADLAVERAKVQRVETIGRDELANALADDDEQRGWDAGYGHGADVALRIIAAALTGEGATDQHFHGCPTTDGRPFDCDYCQERARSMAASA